LSAFADPRPVRSLQMPTLAPSEVTRRVRRQAPSRTAALYTCWADSASDVAAAQSLRRSVFFDEMGARPSAEAGPAGALDVDHFDAFCDHLLIKARDPGDAGDDQVVGTYRVLSPEAARRAGGYYTDTEFDLRPWHALGQGAAELGRSCVHRDWRRGGVIMMLWTALGAYMEQRGLATLFGCCSVPLTDHGLTARAIWNSLSGSHLVDAAARASPRLPFDLGPPDCAPARGDPGVATPALMKGYLRCGARLLGPPAHDPAFNTADFPMMLRLADLSPSYRQHFTRSAS
jgi:putative hemolysin